MNKYKVKATIFSPAYGTREAVFIAEAKHAEHVRIRIECGKYDKELCLRDGEQVLEFEIK